MEYIFERKNEEGGVTREAVALERWAWGVVYKDGTELRQFDSEGGRFHQIGEVKQDEVRDFVLYRTDGMPGKIVIPVPEGAKLIHTYVHRGFVDGAGKHEVKVYRFGVKVGAAEFCSYVMPDDAIVQAFGPLSIDL